MWFSDGKWLLSPYQDWAIKTHEVFLYTLTITQHTRPAVHLARYSDTMYHHLAHKN